MRKLSPIVKLLFKALLCCLLLGASATFADPSALDRTALVTQQIDLLKNRLNQANQELAYLDHQKQKGFSSLMDDDTSKFLLYKTGLQIASTKSSLDSISIELADSEQALSLLEKNLQELENQLNALSIFGRKLMQDDLTQTQTLRAEMDYQEKLYALEKTRAGYLQHLQKTQSEAYGLYRERYADINAYLKSRKLLHMKEHQFKSELEFQKQQNYWLEQLNGLYGQMKSAQAAASKTEYLRLENEVFYANENINLVYLKMLISRYRDQTRQMRLSISRTTSVTLLNTLSDQAQALGKQILRVDGLVDDRVTILKKRRTVFLFEVQNKSQALKPASAKADSPENKATLGKLTELENTYQGLHKDVDLLNKRLGDFRFNLDKSIQHELSARQGLPGFGTDAWRDLGKDVILVPTLSFKLMKGLVLGVVNGFSQLKLSQLFLGVFLEMLGVLAYVYFQRFLAKSQQLLAVCLKRNLWPLALLINVALVFRLLGMEGQPSYWVLAVGEVWLFFRAISILARVSLVETLLDNHGNDVKLYRSLKAICIFGAFITSFTVFLHQLPVIYEIKDLFDRLFLLWLLVASVAILRFWRVLPDLVLDNVVVTSPSLRRIIYFLGVFIPGLIFVNSLLGLFGFVNLVWMFAWYEGVFTGVLVLYFWLRALLNEGMEAVSSLLIRSTTNGWLWTEAFLKPIHKLIRLFLFLGSWTLLFLFYGWDQQSPVVERFTTLLLYPMAHVLNTTITPLGVLELIFVFSLFYWAARWTREFVFRLLLRKTKDQGIRNSIAILSQYAVIILGSLFSLELLGIDLHALFLLGSGLLIALSFGLKDLVNNFACGLLLLFERPLRVGDIVSVNGQEGKVTNIGSRAVNIRTWDHMDVIVPNTEIFNKSFVNWTVKDDVVRTVINIKIDRQDDPHTVQQIIQEVLTAHQNVLKEPATEVFMKDMVDSVCEFELRYFINVRQVVSRVGVRSEILFALWNAFSAHGIKAPNLQHEVWIKSQTTPLLPAPAK